MATKKKRPPDFKPHEAPPVLDERFYGMELDPEQQAFANAIWDPEVDIIFCNARAGTGKTTIAAGVANMLVGYDLYDGIVYIMCPYGERKQGYLPGDITEKSSVYFEAFYQALVNIGVNPNTDVSNESIVNQKNGTGVITCITDTFLRGTNLNDTVVIIDESQNATAAQLKKILTRVGKHTKVICVGHDGQIDLDQPGASGFARYIEHFRGQDRARICTLSQNHRGWISQWADELDESPPGDGEQ